MGVGIKKGRCRKERDRRGNKEGKRETEKGKKREREEGQGGRAKRGTTLCLQEDKQQSFQHLSFARDRLLAAWSLFLCFHTDAFLFLSVFLGCVL